MPEVSLFTIQSQGGFWVVRQSVLYKPEEDKPGRFRPRKGRTQVGAGTVVKGEEAEYYLRRAVASVDAVRFPQPPSPAQVEEVLASGRKELSEAGDAGPAGANIRGVRRKKRVSYKFILGRFLSASVEHLLDAIYRGASEPWLLDKAVANVREAGYLSAGAVQVASCVGFLVDRMGDEPERFRSSVSLALLAVGLAAASRDKPGRRRLPGYKVEAMVTAALLSRAAEFAGEYALLKNLKDSSILGKVRRYRPGDDDLARALAAKYRGLRKGIDAPGAEVSEDYRVKRGSFLERAAALLDRLAAAPLEEFIEGVRRMEAEEPARYRSEYAEPMQSIVEEEGPELSALLVLDEVYADRSFLRARNESARIAKYVYWGIRGLDPTVTAGARVPAEGRLLGKLQHYVDKRNARAGFPISGRGILGVLPGLRDRGEVDALLDALEAYDRAGAAPAGGAEPLPRVRVALKDYVMDREIILETRLFELGLEAQVSIDEGLAPVGEAPRDLTRRVHRLLLLLGPFTPRWAETCENIGRPADFASVAGRLRHDPRLAEFRFVEDPVYQACRTRAAERLVRQLGGAEAADRLLARIEAAAAELLKQRCVLIIEDDPAIRFIEETSLGGEGYRVCSAPGWLDGARLLAEEIVDLVILDLGLPDVHGLEILKHLRADPATKSLPVVVVSAMGRREVVVEAIRLGAQDYVVKPFRIDTLVQKVRTVIESSRRQAP